MATASYSCLVDAGDGLLFGMRIGPRASPAAWRPVHGLSPIPLRHPRPRAVTQPRRTPRDRAAQLGPLTAGRYLAIAGGVGAKRQIVITNPPAATCSHSTSPDAS